MNNDRARWIEEQVEKWHLRPLTQERWHVILRDAMAFADKTREVGGEREFFLSWILRAYESRKREGWEDGMTQDELDAALLDILFNYGADPGLPQHKQLVAKLRAMPPIRHATPAASEKGD